MVRCRGLTAVSVCLCGFVAVNLVRHTKPTHTQAEPKTLAIPSTAQKATCTMKDNEYLQQAHIHAQVAAQHRAQLDDPHVMYRVTLEAVCSGCNKIIYRNPYMVPCLIAEAWLDHRAIDGCQPSQTGADNATTQPQGQ